MMFVPIMVAPFPWAGASSFGGPFFKFPAFAFVALPNIVAAYPFAIIIFVT